MAAHAPAPRAAHRALPARRILTRAALAGALGGLLLAASSPAIGGPLFNTADCATLTPGTTAFFCFDQTSQTLREWDGGRWTILPLVNARDFGAIGNGTNDDTDSVIQAVVAAAAVHSVVIFPATKQSYNLARSFDPKGVTFVLLGASLSGAGAPTANVVTLDKNGHITTGGTLTATTLEGNLNLTSPIGVPSGGTGLATAASGSFLTGNGTGAFTLVAPPIGVPNGGTGAATLTGLVLGNGAAAMTAYGGTSCTNQFPRSLSAAGAATCASVALGADVSGTLPAANGGTGGTGGVQFIAASTQRFSLAQGTTCYTHPFGATCNGTESTITGMTLGASWTAKNLYVATPGGGPAPGQTLTVTMYRNDAATTLTCAITGGGSNTCPDITHTVGFAAGDQMTIQFTTTATTGTLTPIVSIVGTVP